MNSGTQEESCALPDDNKKDESGERMKSNFESAPKDKKEKIARSVRDEREKNEPKSAIWISKSSLHERKFVVEKKALCNNGCNE